MHQIILAEKDLHRPEIHDLFLEYLEWGTSMVYREYGVVFPLEETIEQDMAGLGKFMPPKGRLLLAYVGDTPAGVACLKELESHIGEVKRMYVRPAQRGRGIGRALLLSLMDEATTIGYTSLRLDSARFMNEAHRLYRSMGFTDIEPYEGSEIPQDFRRHWVFMEKKLRPDEYGDQ